MVAEGDHLEIGSLLFEGLDQIDLTGPFEVLSRMPNSTLRLYGKTLTPVRDVRGLRLTPDATLAEAPQLDVLHIPGGFGQEALMVDAETLGWIARRLRARAASSPSVPVRFSAAPPGSCKNGARRRTGPRTTCCRFSALSPWMPGSCSTATSSALPA